MNTTPKVTVSDFSGSRLTLPRRSKVQGSRGCVPAGSYLALLSLKWGAGAVVTDAGIVQDETTALGVPCFTLRSSTERTATVTHGTNVLLGRDARDVAYLADLARERVPAAIPSWDGRAARRIARTLVATYALVPVRRVS